MTEPSPPGGVALPGGIVMGPDGSISFPGQQEQDQAAAEGLTPVAPGFPLPRRPAPPPAGTGQFTVDLERAPQALRELEDARTKLESIRRDMSGLGQVIPPGQDATSRDAATALALTAVGGPGSFIAALSEGIVRLTDLIQKVRDDLQQYSRAESNGNDVISSTTRT